MLGRMINMFHPIKFIYPIYTLNIYNTKFFLSQKKIVLILPYIYIWKNTTYLKILIRHIKGLNFKTKKKNNKRTDTCIGRVLHAFSKYNHEKKFSFPFLLSLSKFSTFLTVTKNIINKKRENFFSTIKEIEIIFLFLFKMK